MKQTRCIVIAAGLAASLSGCGGGNDAPAAPAGPTDAQGLWTGTTSTGRTVYALVLDDGNYWVLYSGVGSPDVVAGVIEGDGTGVSGAFNSSNALDFNIETGVINGANIAGNYVAKGTLDGTATYKSVAGSVVFNTTYDAIYDQAPDLAAAAGTYSGEAAVLAGEEPATVTVTSGGALSGSSQSGCSYHGTATPRATGNAYDVAVTFEGGVCSNGTSTVNGVAFFDTAAKRIYSSALNGGRSNGFLFIGAKP